jgi:hypothetical protein
MELSVVAVAVVEPEVHCQEEIHVLITKQEQEVEVVQELLRAMEALMALLMHVTQAIRVHYLQEEQVVQMDHAELAAS